MKIGILALQGAFIEHRAMLEKLGAGCALLRQKSDIKELDGLVLPGGESTVQGKLLKELDMFDTLKDLIKNGIPSLTTCAGLILLAEHISNDSNMYFGTLPVTVKRNAYGKQLGSFSAVSSYKGLDDFNMIFIRAPFIEDPKDTEVLAEIDNKVVGVRYKNQIGLSFHPEIGDDNRIHKAFLEMT